MREKIIFITKNLILNINLKMKVLMTSLRQLIIWTNLRIDNCQNRLICSIRNQLNSYKKILKIPLYNQMENLTDKEILKEIDL
jgi:hypothetical protein